MADYFSLLAKAVSNLPKGSPVAARKPIYDRARAALSRQLRALGPTLSESDIVREEAALESAIIRLEAQFSPATAAPAASRAESLARPAAPPPAAPAAPAFASVGEPGTAGPADHAPPAAVPPLRPPSRPSFAAPARHAATVPSPLARTVEAAVEPPPPAPPPLVAESKDAGAAGAFAPPVSGADETDRAAYVPAAGAHDALRPSAPGRADAPRAGVWPWIVVGFVFAVVFAVAVAAFLLRQKPQDLAIAEPPEASVSAGEPAPAAKIVERIGGAETPTPAASAAATPAAAPTPAASAPAPAASSPAAATPAANAPAVAVASPAAALPVAARAAMLVAVASDPQKPAISLGSVVWSTVPAVAGQPSTVGVKADADIPDLKMHVSMILRKNADPSLPASHTIDLRMSFDDGAQIKGIKDMRVPLMRRDDPPAQDSLAGVRVKISDGYFLVGLNRADADAARNVQLIADRGWFDFPLLLDDDRIAKLTFEKGADGERMIADALAAWK
jgi:hypothetical protein